MGQNLQCGEHSVDSLDRQVVQRHLGRAALNDVGSLCIWPCVAQVSGAWLTQCLQDSAQTAAGVPLKPQVTGKWEFQEE